MSGELEIVEAVKGLVACFVTEFSLTDAFGQVRTGRRGIAVRGEEGKARSNHEEEGIATTEEKAISSVPFNERPGPLPYNASEVITAGHVDPRRSLIVVLVSVALALLYEGRANHFTQASDRR